MSVLRALVMFSDRHLPETLQKLANILVNSNQLISWTFPHSGNLRTVVYYFCFGDLFSLPHFPSKQRVNSRPQLTYCCVSIDEFFLPRRIF